MTDEMRALLTPQEASDEPPATVTVPRDLLMQVLDEAGMNCAVASPYTTGEIAAAERARIDQLRAQAEGKS